MSPERPAGPTHGQVSVMSPERPIQKQRRTVPAQLGLLEPSAGAFQTGLSVPGLHEDYRAAPRVYTRVCVL